MGRIAPGRGKAAAFGRWNGREDSSVTTILTSETTAAALLAELGPERGLDMLLKMLVIRAFENKAQELYSLGRVHGTMHLSIGQEAAAIGTSAALSSDDFLLNTHRGHGHCIGWGSDPRLMMAEFMGKDTGYCRGRGGSMHIADVEANNLGANGIVAGGLPLSVGVGLSIKLRRTDQVVLSIFGDGAANEGAFHEVAQHGQHLEPADRLPVRKQPVRHVDVDRARVQYRAYQPARLRIRHPGRDRGRQRCPGDVCGGQRGPAPGPRPAKGRR